MEFIDTHTHLYDESFQGEAQQDAAVVRAVGNGVGRMIIPDECSSSRPAMLALCDRWAGRLFPCAGLHPTELGTDWKVEMDKVEAVLESRKDIVAIGECGMDLYWSKEQVKEQEEAFRVQMELAIHHEIPLIIHAREATSHIFQILEDFKGRGLRGVFHAFSGSVETFRNMEKYGNWYVGIGGVLTFKNAGIAHTIKEIPLERILLETDSPYLTPAPHRGERNESANIPIIADFLATCKGVSVEEVADWTTNNAEKLFSLQKIGKERVKTQ